MKKKSKKSFVGMLAIVLALSLVLFGCPDDSGGGGGGDGEPTILQGTWEAIDGEVITFMGNIFSSYGSLGGITLQGDRGNFELIDGSINIIYTQVTVNSGETWSNRPTTRQISGDFTLDENENQIIITFTKDRSGTKVFQRLGTSSVPSELLGRWVNKENHSIILLQFNITQLLSRQSSTTTTYFTKESNGKIEMGTSPNNKDIIFCESYSITDGELTFTGGQSNTWYENVAFVRPNYQTLNPTELTNNIWTESELNNSVDPREEWYSFNATAGSTYRIWLNGSLGDGSKTLVTRLSAYYNDGTVIIENNGSTWANPQVVSPSESGIIYLRVTPSTATGTGTYGIVYSTETSRPNPPFDPPENYTTLILNEWMDGTINDLDEYWYSFEVVAGTQYRIWWNDSSQGNRLKTSNIRVSAWHTDGTPFLNNVDNGWSSTTAFTPASNGTVYVKVTIQSILQIGTYGIVYSTETSRPNPPFNPPESHTNLKLNEWMDGSINVARSEVWYSFDVNNENEYRIWWNDSFQGNNTKTLDVRVSAWHADGTQILDYVDSGWNSTISFTPDNGKVYVRVYAFNSNNTGTFRIIFSTDTTRPASPITPSSTPVVLVADQWVNGISTEPHEDWYSFEVTAGTPYRIWWNDFNQGNYLKTLDVRVSAWYGNSGNNIIYNVDNGWTSSTAFTPPVNEIVYVRVTAFTGSTGSTYGIVYNTSSNIRPALSIIPETHEALTNGIWKDGEINNPNEEAWYSFNVTSGETYRFWLNRNNTTTNNNGDGFKSLTARADAWYSDGTSIFNYITSAWSTPRNFIPTSNGTVYIRIIGDTATSIGNFGIVYTENNTTRPAVSSIVFPTATELTLNTWKDGELINNNQEWYSFNATQGSAYYIWTNFSGSSTDGDGSKTLNPSISIYYSDGTVITDINNSRWNTPINFNAASTGTVYIKISSSSRGTFGVAYNTNNTRPAVPFVHPENPTNLTLDTWQSSYISTREIQWFKFKATATTQYIHINTSLSGGVYVQLFDLSGNPVVSESSFNPSGRIERALANGQDYYIRVRPRSSSSWGNYHILFNDSSDAPPLP